ncbi:hypothetical protein ACPPVO_14715 [Dactylosporangium sp. McL0621]|uniref:hypothetical protein n=1 Tax=Dactylosporangium sp. McL0621 TaxID=3415678 RepID=UPI003CF32C68
MVLHIVAGVVARLAGYPVRSGRRRGRAGVPGGRTLERMPAEKAKSDELQFLGEEEQ